MDPSPPVARPKLDICRTFEHLTVAEQSMCDDILELLLKKQLAPDGVSVEGQRPMFWNKVFANWNTFKGVEPAPREIEDRTGQHWLRKVGSLSNDTWIYLEAEEPGPCGECGSAQKRRHLRHPEFDPDKNHPLWLRSLEQHPNPPMAPPEHCQKGYDVYIKGALGHEYRNPSVYFCDVLHRDVPQCCVTLLPGLTLPQVINRALDDFDEAESVRVLNFNWALAVEYGRRSLKHKLLRDAGIDAPPDHLVTRDEFLELSCQLKLLSTTIQSQWASQLKSATPEELASLRWIDGKLTTDVSRVVTRPSCSRPYEHVLPAAGHSHKPSPMLSWKVSNAPSSS
ncbi:hypothetical protein GE09DRAFT_152686 [Coniochaeta sp. 2T2.1]|nr:hypothetical protein GE09DRAFT_152686 [Coniochaeta sp. 2T2.1]